MSQGKIGFGCPQCGKVVAAGVEHAGKKAKCIGCGAIIFVPRNRVDLLILEHQRNIASLATQEIDLKARVERLQHDLGAVDLEYRASLSQLDAAKSELATLEENLEDISYGIYKPHFTFQDSTQYKAALAAVREKQKLLVKAGSAATCATTWSVGGSEREGQKMIKQYQKLLLRAFNGEADAAVAKVTWTNFRVMVTRIRKAQEALNKLGAVMQITVEDAYRDLKLEELRLEFEQEEKKQQEREEQRRLKAQMKEEERVQRELAIAQKEVEDEERTYEEAIQLARREAEASLGEERDAFLQRIKDLEGQLENAHEKQRAISQAQLTKSGHVYIISNVGSFGDQIYKIGMTRRQKPHDRIQELGDASVPFPFDLHAMIPAKNAPELECEIQTHFWDRRVNRANDRKEFFRITLEEIEKFVAKKGLAVQLTMLAEAKEYRQTLAEPTMPNDAPASCVNASRTTNR